MKIAVLTIIASDDIQQIGVWQKILGIQKAFGQENFSCDVFHLTKDGICKNNAIEIPHNDKRVKRRVYIFKAFFNQLHQYELLSGYDVLWIRHAFWGPSFHTVMLDLKRQDPNLKILYELPTYPYLQEFKGIKRLLSYLHEKYVISKFPKFVDRVITYSEHSSIYHIPTIIISNGIDISNIPVVKRSDRKESIELIAIGVLWDWFGLDRVIKGLHAYYSKPTNHHSITLTIIGQGNADQYLKKLVQKYQLSDHVYFKGWMTPLEIQTEITDNYIGVGTLAIHRKKVLKSSSLKHREYTARGIPFMFSGKETSFDKDLPFILSVPENDNPIDIEKVIQFHQQTRGLSLDIRSFAEQHFDWATQLKPVIKYVRQSE